MEIEPPSTRKRPRLQPYAIYLAAISVVGLGLAVWGAVQLLTFSSKINFLLLLLLAILVQNSAISFSFSQKSAITYALGPAVSIAVVPFYGPAAAALVETFTAISLWLFKPAEERTWKKSWSQLAFNTGMSSITIYVTGLVFLLIRDQLGAGTIAGATVPWLLAAVVNDQVNLWLVIAIMRLQRGKEIDVLELWRENLWAMPIGIVTVSIGGGILAYAVQQFDWIGVIVFFLPIFLSSLADQVYVRQMQAHLDNLEEIVAERTRELAERTEQLQALMREKDAFLSVLTHDMKTPLTTIGLYAQLISKQPLILREKPHMSEVILRSQQTLEQIVNNILDLERLQSGDSLSLEPEHFDLVSLAEYTLETVKPHADKKQIHLTSQVKTPAIPVVADRHQMERVLLNLLSNAVKYTPLMGEVNLSLWKNGQYVTIAVRDNGYGIPADELDHIFEPYRRVSKNKNKAAGTGLGLAITKALVEAHEGEICVTSEEEVGSEFVVNMPICHLEDN